MKPSINCKHCQKEFIPKRYRVQKFCSTSCRVANFQLKKRITNESFNGLAIPPPLVPQIDKFEIPKPKPGVSPVQSALINVSAIALNEGAKNLGIYKTKETKLLIEVLEKQKIIELELKRLINKTNNDLKGTTLNFQRIKLI